jgi:hypothetical protein
MAVVSYSGKWPRQRSQILQFLSGYLVFNPHLSLGFTFDGKEQIDARAPPDPTWRKWLPSDPNSPHWYNRTRLERLLGAYARKHGGRMVREFVGEFRGLSGSAKGGKVLEESGLARTTTAELFDAAGKPSPQIGKLLAAMQANSAPVKPADSRHHRRGALAALVRFRRRRS